MGRLINYVIIIYMRFVAPILFVALLCLSCSNNTGSNPGDYRQFISKLPTIKIDHKLQLTESDLEAYSPMQVEFYDQEMALVLASEPWTILLIDEEGQVIDRIHNIGRGPGEYTQINQMHVGFNKSVYLFDARLRKILVYSVNEGQFSLEEERALQPYDSYSFSEFYNTPSGNIGLFKDLSQSQTREISEYFAFSLGADLQMEDSLFKVPGNELYTYQDLKVDKPFGYETEWDLEENTFYYSYSDRISVSARQLNQIDEIHKFVPEIPRPHKTDKRISFKLKRLEVENLPDIEKVIREGNYFPHFRDFVVGPSNYFFTLYEESPDHGTLLAIDRNSNEMRKIVVPSLFRIYDVSANKIFGIDHTDNANEVMIMTLAEAS
ncbi:MAG: 6-bladed beta-propeller [Balneolaceae bacterium]|nr:6-bladed beta-propeller [Balneolaceae bacterium]